MADNDKKTLDYGAFLADLEAKRSVLDQAIASVRAVMSGGALASMGATGQLADLMSGGIHGGEIPAGAFLGKSIPEATKLYLSIVKQKQTTREIAEALQKGGMETTSKNNFEGIVAAGLNRVRKVSGEILKVGRAWALAEWYPAGIRAAAGQEKSKGRKAKKARKQKAEKAAAMGGSVGKDGRIRFPRLEPDAPSGEKKPQERIADLLRRNPSQVYTSKEVSEVLNIEARIAGPTLGRLAAAKQIEKIGEGNYRAAHV